MIDSHNLEQFARHVAEQPSCPRWLSPACHSCLDRPCLDDPASFATGCAASEHSWKRVALWREDPFNWRANSVRMIGMLTVSHFARRLTATEHAALRRLVRKERLQ